MCVCDVVVVVVGLVVVVVIAVLVVGYLISYVDICEAYSNSKQ